MNSIYKLLIVAIVCLLSNITQAQIYQYSDNGKEACLDCPSKSATERDCYCTVIFDFARFEANIPTDHTRDAWLQAQEGVLKETIEKDFFFGQQFDTYEHAQEAFFELYQGNTQAAIYYPRILESFENEVGHNPLVYTSSREKATILERRRTELELVSSGQPRQIKFGDLKYNNQRIEDITGVAYLNQQIGNELNTFNAEHDRAKRLDWLKQKYDQAVLDRRIENFLARQFTYHYATLGSAEERIRLMTAYLVAYNSRNETLIVVNNGFSPQGIDLRNQDFTERLTNIIRDYDIVLDPVNAYNPNIDNAIFNHALKTEFSETSRNFLRKVPNQPYKDVLKGYLQSNEYSAGAMSLSNDLTTSNVNGVAMENSYLNFSHNQAYPPDHWIHLFEFGQSGNSFASWHHSNTAVTDGMANFFELTESLRELGSLNPTTEGDLIESALFVAGRYQIQWSSFTHADLGNMFNLSHFTLSGLAMGQVVADHNLGQILLDNGFPAYQFFQSDFALEAGLEIANGNTNFDFPHREAVFNVVQQLNLSDAERTNLLNANRQLAIGLEEFIDTNTPAGGSIPPNVISASREIMSGVLAGGANALAQTIEIIGTIEQFPGQDYPRADVMRDINRMNNYLRGFGYRPFAEYLDTIIPTLPGYSNDELHQLHVLVYNVTKQLKGEYINAIIGGFTEGVTPIIEIVLFEYGGNLAIRMLEKLPALLKTADILKIIANLKSVSNFGALRYAKQFGINTFAELETLFANLGFNRTELGVQFHHLFEQRFVTQLTERLGSNTRQWKSIVVTAEEHQAFTNAWRQRIGYGTTEGTSGFYTSNAPLSEILKAAREIYKDYPEILKALGL